MTESMRLVEITPANVRAACAIVVKPEQEGFVAPVAVSLAEAYVHPDRAWPRLILDDDRIVGFVMAGFNAANENEALRAGIWRLNIAGGEQGRGYGRFAVNVVVGETRRRGHSSIRVSWKPGQHGPEEFYLRLGFRPTGEVSHGETVAMLMLQ